MIKVEKILKNTHISFLFPLALLFILLIMTTLKISGSSAGPFYDMHLNGEYSESLIAGSARGVRTDEWLVTTQLTIAQEKAGYPLVNTNIGQGKDMSLITDVPYKEWSTIFKSQNLAFFIIPFENAFAFKWWFLIISLMICVYYLALRFLPGNYVASILIAITGALAPFVFWWYQTITIMPIVWALLFTILTLRLFDNRSFKVLKNQTHALIITQVILSISIAYSLTSFALILYPAFQIPIIIALGLFLVGYFINEFRDGSSTRKKELKRSFWYVISGTLLALAITGAFVATRLESIQDLTHTVYPGARDIAAGEFAPKHSINFMGFNQYRLESDAIQSTIPSNQSEISTFLILSVIFILPIIILSYWHMRRYKKIDWILAMLLFGNLILLCHFFLPFFTPVSKLLFLNLVPQVRTFIGFGFLGILSLIYLIHFLNKYRTYFSAKFHTALIVSYGITIALYSIVGTFYIQEKFPEFSGNLLILSISAIVYTTGLMFILSRKYIIGLFLLTMLSISLVDTVQPISKGLGQVYSGEIIAEINNISDENTVWGVSGDYLLENIPVAAGQKSITGTQFSPDNDFWDNVDSKDTDFVYNRYAHVILNDQQEEPLKLIQADFFSAKLSCSGLVHDTITHVISTIILQVPCYKLIKQLDYRQRSIYFYERFQP